MDMKKLGLAALVGAASMWILAGLWHKVVAHNPHTGRRPNGHDTNPGEDYYTSEADSPCAMA